MSEADKILEKIGYFKICDDDKEIRYLYKKYLKDEWFQYTLIFSKVSKIFIKYEDDYDDMFHAVGFDMRELIAIHQKCEELGWIPR